MRGQLGRSAAIGAALLAVVGGASVTGRYLGTTECHEVTSTSSLTSAVLAVIAVFRRPPAGYPATERATGIALLVWLVVATVTEQFAWAYDARGVLIGVAWLLAPVIGAVALLGRREWFAAAACSAALFAGATALSYSATHAHAGIGLISVWRS